MSLQPPRERPRLSTSSTALPLLSSHYSPSSSTEGNVSPLLPPFVPSSLRPPMFKHSTMHSAPVSQSRTPFLTPQVSTTNVVQPSCGMTLLMPTVRPPRPTTSSVTSPVSRLSSTRSSPAKLSRSRAGSLAASLQPSPDLNAAPTVTIDWIGGGCQFEIVEEQIELEGYQIYAVEKWVVERRRPVTVLTVFTGDPSHKITVTALSPFSSLPASEVQREWDKAIHQLRRDGARPKETEKGMVMVTSLANFRSDYTIVHIPGGNFLDVREQLYTNINVLRMGCSGRSALTLEEPSDTTKDRFISAYHVPEKALVRSSELFNSTVLELVKLIQAALSVCGMFDLSKEERNGLLCDVTCEGIQRWVTEIGESCANVEPMERVADPTVVAALFSTVLTVRNRLHAMGHFVPKDPFIDPLAFVKALTAFGSSKPHAHAHTLSLTHYSLQPPTLSHSVTSSPVQAVYLSQSLIETINAAYDKAKQSDTYKVHRVLINKLDDLATDLRTNPEPGGSTKGLFRWASNLVPTTDLGGFVKTISESSKDGAPSLRYLWTGRPGEVARKRKEKEMVWSEGEEKEREKELEKEIRGKEKDEKEREREKEKEVKSSEDEGDFLGGMPWSGRMQRKIESWAALGRTKKTSMDLGVRSRDGPNSPSRGPSEPASVVPSVVVSEPLDDDDILTSGQVSPASGAPTRSRLTFGNLPRAERSIGELSDYGRRVTEFNQKNPPAKPHIQGRIVSWSDPKTARDDVDSERGRTSKRRTLSPLKDSISDAQASKDSLFELEQETSRTTAKRLQALKKRRSFDDADALRGTRILPVDRMRIDAELCGQILVMRRREQHLANVLACLDALTSDLSATNSSLRQDYTSKLPEIEEVKRRAGLLQDIEAARVRADALTQETNALAYESAQFFVDDLWQMAALPRQKVFVMRERVFGTGRRLPQGVHGAHGRFNREQFTLDGRGRLVDTLGRTESEVEEENELPGLSRLVHEDEEDVVEHASLKPTWLLRMFNYWGSKWGTSGDVGKEKEKSQERQDDLRNRTTKSASMHESMTSATESRASLSRNKTIF